MSLHQLLVINLKQTVDKIFVTRITIFLSFDFMKFEMKDDISVSFHILMPGSGSLIYSIFIQQKGVEIGKHSRIMKTVSLRFDYLFWQLRKTKA